MTVKAPNTQANAANEDTEKPMGVRDSIRAAMDEHREPDEKELKNKEKNDANNVEDDEKVVKKEPKGKVEEDKEEEKDDKSSEKQEDKSEDKDEDDEDKKEEKDTKQVSAPDKDTKVKQPIPYGMPKEVREKWSGLSGDVQELIINTHKKAVNDTKAETGRQISPDLREVDAVLTPYRPAIQQAGVTAAQIVKKVLEYSDGLAGPNKYQVLQQIANDFNIDLARFNKPSKQTQGQIDQQTDAEDEFVVDLPPEVHQKLDTILSKFEQNNQSQAVAQKEAQRKAAEDVVHAWSGFNAATQEHTNKPYFPYVRQTMFALMKANPNQYAMADGKLDLDRVYDDACHADPELREIMIENARLAKAEADRKIKEKKTKDIANAKAKNLSLKPSNSSIGGSSQRAGLNGKDPKKGPASVRDSIMSAIQENR